LLKILIISAVFPPEPVVSAMLSRDIADELSKKNDVVVLCPKPSRPDGFRFEKNFGVVNYAVVQLDSFTCSASRVVGRLRESYSFGIHSAKYIKENSALIECIYINSWPLFAQYFIIKAAKKLSIPSVIHIQDIYPESLTNKLPNPIKGVCFHALLPMDKFILRNATKIIGISKNMVSYLTTSRKVDKNKFELVRNWQDDSSFLSYVPGNDSKSDFVFMYLGSLSQSAGVETIINSFHLANLPKTKLIIAGNGSDKENCMAIVRRLGNHQIEFCEVSPEKVPELQSQAEVLLLPLKKGIAKTATPSKLTAYLLSSKPIIACVETESDVADIINSANCGYIVEPENVESLALAMKQVYNMEKSELETLGVNGRDYALGNLSKKTNLKKIVTVIENLVHGDKKDR
jgi:glycosyltransferase involved in cell wall biosynthesis